MGEPGPSSADSMRRLCVNNTASSIQQMSEEADESQGIEIVAGTYLLFGLIVPPFFNTLTQAQEISIFLVVFSAFAACILYGELALSLPSGVAFGFGMILTSYAAQNWWLIGLAISAVATNLAKNWREPNAIELEDAGFDLPPRPANNTSEV
jgi:hypothetical protein